MSLYLNSPLEQFNIIVMLPLRWFGYDISITNLLLSLLICALFLWQSSRFASRKIAVIPNNPQRIFENVFLFVHGIMKQQGGILSIKFLPVFITLFLLIFFLNLFGLAPWNFTVTSQVAFTAQLGFSLLIAILIVGLQVLKLKWFRNFLPNVSGPVFILLVIIEIFSFLLRPISLSIRLFANMLAGHTLLSILTNFCLEIFYSEVFGGLLVLLPILAVTTLEFGIGGLQAYVFLVLLLMYIKESFYGVSH